MKSLLLLVLIVGCGDVHGMPFGGELPGTGGAAAGSAGAVLVAGTGGAPQVNGTGGSVNTPPPPVNGTGGAPATGGAGGVPGTGGGAAVGGAAGGNPRVVYVEALPLCPSYVTEFGSPIGTARLCGVSSDDHLLYGCVGVERQGYPLDTTPCQFVDTNNAYNGSNVFGCVDAHGC